MAEYWKSTPKYWCKFCQTFVRDTPFAKREHESTGRHQGAIQRSLRQLHKTSEREERDKQRAKDEVARLNGVIGGKAPAALPQSRPLPRKSEPPKQVSPEERKRQIAQLAEMGIAIPEEYRKDIAVVGEWQSTGVTRILTQDTTLKGEDEDDVKPEDRSFGVRKRKNEEDDEVEEQVVRRGWGSTFKQYHDNEDGPIDMEALMTKTPKQEADGVDEYHDALHGMGKEEKDDSLPQIKEECTEEQPGPCASAMTDDPSGSSVKEEEAPAAPMFKKRKTRVPVWGGFSN